MINLCNKHIIKMIKCKINLSLFLNLAINLLIAATGWLTRSEHKKKFKTSEGE